MSTIATLSSGRRGEPRRGAWPLEPGRVVRLRPRSNVIHSWPWITFERAPVGALNESGDFILAPGQPLHVPAGETVVISAFGKRGASASFDWELPVLRQRSWRESFARLLASLRPRPAAFAR